MKVDEFSLTKAIQNSKICDRTSAFSGYVPDGNGRFHSYIGLSLPLLQASLSLSDWVSWKEQLSFGGNLDHFAYSNVLPIVRAELPGISNDFLYFVLAHEMGHILDFANHGTRYQGGCSPMSASNPKDCQVDPTSFGGLSWETNRIVKPSADFRGRSGLCFYFCDGHFLDWPDLSTFFYDDLFRAGFVSTYGASNIRDDFAESTAYFVTSLVRGATYMIQMPDGRRYNVMEEIRSTKTNAKIEFIRDLVSKPDIVLGGTIDYL